MPTSSSASLKLPAVLSRPHRHALIDTQLRAARRSRTPLKHFIFRVRDVAILLWANGEERAALTVLDFATAQATPRSGPDAWYASATSAALASFFRRSAKLAKAKTGLESFIEPASHAIFSQPKQWTAAFVKKHLVGERARFAPRFTSDRASSAAEAHAWWLATTVFFREAAELGYPARASGRYIEDLERMSESALGEVKAFLARTG